MQGFVIEEASIGLCDEINNFFEMVLRHTFEVNMLSELEDLILEEIEDKRRCLNQCFETMGQDRYFLIASLEGKVMVRNWWNIYLNIIEIVVKLCMWVLVIVPIYYHSI